MRRADRLFQIVLLLNRGRAVTARELATALEVSERTVYRDIADLSASGVPVDGAAGVGYLMRKGYHLPPLMFDADELAALALGMRMVGAWADAGLGRAAERALLKIEAVLPADRKAGADAAAMVVPSFFRPAAEKVAPLGILRAAIRDGRKLRFGYRRADGAASERTVWPLGLFFWGETWTLGGWCELRGEFRSFRIDRMAPPQVLAERFESAAGRSLEDYVRAVAGTS